MMASEDEDVQVFALNATIKLGNMVIVLIDALRESRRSQGRNPLPWRAQLER